jgi:hypothetical protein
VALRTRLAAGVPLSGEATRDSVFHVLYRHVRGRL